MPDSETGSGGLPGNSSGLSPVTELYYEFENNHLFRALCGVADSQISSLAQMLGVELIPRGHAFIIRSGSDPSSIERARRYFLLLEERYGSEGSHLPERFDREYLFKHLLKEESRSDGFSGEDLSHEQLKRQASPSVQQKKIPEEELESLKEKVFTTHRGRPIYPRTINQADYVRSLLENTVTFSMGPAGTGKTFLGIAVAARMLLNGEVERIVLTRPAVEAGESLGFLPGDLAQKVDPYLRPIYDALYECLGVEKVQELIALGKIEIAPLAYMRGRTLNQAFVILDEAQNCTLAQLKMFLTRLGRNSRMCIGGDGTQIDIEVSKSGLTKATNLLKNVPGIHVVFFGVQDIIRNPLVEKIIQAFDRELND